MSYENKLTIGFLVHESVQQQLQYSLEGKLFNIADLVMTLTELCSRLNEIAETIRISNTNYRRPQIHYATDDLPLRIVISSCKPFDAKEANALLHFVESSMREFISNSTVQLQIIKLVADAPV